MTNPTMITQTILALATWTQEQGIELCRKIEAICPEYGCHVALTGGLLYKDGPRKDCDLLFYRIRQEAEIDKEGLFLALENLGIVYPKGHGWCHKTSLNDGRKLDLFFPEEDSAVIPAESGSY